MLIGLSTIGLDLGENANCVCISDGKEGDNVSKYTVMEGAQFVGDHVA